jgi:hypothetical protein
VSEKFRIPVGLIKFLSGLPLYITPILVPIVLARAGKLSLVRWLIVAAAFLLYGCLVGLGLYFYAINAQNAQEAMIIGYVTGTMIGFAGMSCVGCLLAAAFWRVAKSSAT